MSSENFNIDGIEHFYWNDGLSPNDYVLATYTIDTVAPVESTAVAIAREQSAPILSVGHVSTEAIVRSTARVVNVEPLGTIDDALIPSFHVHTRSYPSPNARKSHRARICLAFPVRNFGPSFTGLWNSIAGEVHRLGFLTALRVDDVELSPDLLDQIPGPLHGVHGIRKLWGVERRPLFCRAARPATGLSTDDMISLNEAVLRGGFDAVKDDELTYDTPLSPFRERVERMMTMVRRVEDATGERKLYFANVIDDPQRALDFSDHAARMGVAGLITAPTLQGLTIGVELARRTGLCIIAHNVGADLLTRAHRWGIKPSLWCKIQRWFGADFVFMPGNFGIPEMSDHDEDASCIVACSQPISGVASCMPILAGGKRPERLQAYRKAVGSPDFMVIASTFVDDHPAGIAAGASEFRQAWQEAEAVHRLSDECSPLL